MCIDVKLRHKEHAANRDEKQEQGLGGLGLERRKRDRGHAWKEFMTSYMKRTMPMEGTTFIQELTVPRQKAPSPSSRAMTAKQLAMLLYFTTCPGDPCTWNAAPCSTLANRQAALTKLGG